MASCTQCGTTILFGGEKLDDKRFCNKRCYELWVVSSAAAEIPEDDLEAIVQRVHEGECPCCGGAGPNDVYTSHKVMSFLVVTTFKSTPAISCRSCARRRQVGAMLVTATLGWWGFPWGICLTPIYILRSLFGIFAGQRTGPSEELRGMVQLNVADQLLRDPTIQAPENSIRQEH